MVDIPKKKTHEQFIKELANINPKVEVLGTYSLAREKIECRCTEDGCGNIWFPTPHKLLLGRGCPKCAVRRTSDILRKSHDDYVNEVAIINPKVKILSKYTGADNKIKCKCLNDGCSHIWEVRAANIYRGDGCAKCKKVLRKTQEEFEKELSLINPKIKVLGKYSGSHVKLKCKCLVCNRTWDSTTARSLLNGVGCPLCKRKREREIYDYLTFLLPEIEIKKNKTFDGLYGVSEKFPLSYDMCFTLNEQIYLIEVQGEQHKKPIYFFGGEEQFKTQQEHDKRKREFAEKNGYHLIEIWYYDDFKDVLNQYNFGQK